MRYDVTDVDSGNLEGHAYAEPGTYHWKILDIQEENEKGNFEARMEIIAGTPKGMEGRAHKEVFYVSPKAISRLIQFAVALKLVTTADIERAKSTGEELEIDWGQAINRQFAGKLRKKKNQDGTMSEYCELGFDIWAVDSKAAKGVALDAKAANEFLAAIGGKTPAKPNASKSNGAAKTTVEPPQSSDAFGGAADDLFGG